MKPKCLMLDVDGVLVFGRPSDGQHWMVGLLDDLGVPPRDLAREFFRAGWQSVVVGQKELLPTLQEALDRIAPDVTAEKLITYWYEMSSSVVPQVLSDVRDARLKGIPVHLATNQSHSRADYLLNTVGLRKEIDGIIYSAMAGHQKPDARFYAFAEVETGYRSDELLMVDDKMENVEAPIAAGWMAVHWTKGDSLAAILQRCIG
ncbi:MAG: HAD family hydrolase [Paracoccaceae bacterium]